MICILAQPMRKSFFLFIALFFSISINVFSQTATVSITPTSISENGGTAIFTVTLSAVDSKENVFVVVYPAAASTSPHESVTIGTSPDFTVSSDTIKIPAGNTNASITVTGQDDIIGENTELAIIKINESSTNPGNAIVGDPNKVELSIVDDEIIVDLHLSTDSIYESGTPYMQTIITAFLSKAAPEDVKVKFRVVPTGTTASTGDYTLSGDLITIGMGDTTGAVTVTVVDDALDEPSEGSLINDILKIEIEYVTGGGADNIGTTVVTINIVDDDNGPQSVDDTYGCTGSSITILEGGSVTIGAADGLLANDSDPEGDTPLEAKKKSNPSFGTLSINTDGSFTYTHNGDEQHSDSFTYYAVDSKGNKGNTKVVTLCITPVNDCPDPTELLLELEPGEKGLGDLKVETNDSDNPKSDFLYTIFPDGDQPDGMNYLKGGVLICPTTGLAGICPDGTFSYTAPNKAVGATPVTVNVWYEVTDNSPEANCPKITKNIKVIYQNYLPIPLNDTVFVGQGETVCVAAPGVLVNDDLGTGGDRSLLEAQASLDPNYGTYNLELDGSFCYTHDGSTTSSIDSLVYVINDGFDQSGETASIIFMINECPESVEHNFVVYEGDSITVGIHAFSLDLATYGLLVGATDADADAISAKVVLDPHHVLPAGLTINPDGSFIYIHDGTEPTLYGDITGDGVADPNFDFFLYSAADDLCDSDPDTVRITIIPLNDCPVTTTDGFNSLGLIGGKHINEYFNDEGYSLDSVVCVQIDADGNAIEDASGTPLEGVCNGINDTLYAYTRNSSGEGITWVKEEYMIEGGELKGTGEEILGDDTDEEGDNVYGKYSTPGKLKLEGKWTAALEKKWKPLFDAGIMTDDSPLHGLYGEVKCEDTGLPGLCSDGSFTYVHDGSENIRDVIYYEACNDGPPDDGIAPYNCCVLDSILLFFGPDNDCAEANNDYYTMNEGDTLNINASNVGVNAHFDSLNGKQFTGIFLNDFDAEGDSLWILTYGNVDYGSSIALIPGNGPFFGEITINPDGSFVYIHDGSDNYFDTITYAMGDIVHAPDECDRKTIYISIEPVNDCPTPSDDQYVVNEGECISIATTDNNLLLNDTDPDMGTLPFIRDLTNLTYYSFETWFTKDTTAGFLGAGGTLDYPAIQVVKDFGGTSYDGHLKSNTTGPKPERDRFGNSYSAYYFNQFLGMDNYIEVDNTVLDINLSGYTISGWIWPVDPNAELTILNFNVGTSEEGISIGHKNSNFTLKIGDGNSWKLDEVITGFNIQTIVDTHFSLVKDGTNYKFYVDGLLVYEKDLAIGLTGPKMSSLQIGRSYTSGNYFNGKIDDIYVYRKPIDNTQAYFLYKSLYAKWFFGPNNGTVTCTDTGASGICADGSFTYCHDGSPTALDIFKYLASDSICDTEAEAIINVIQINDCPIPLADTFYIDEGGSLNLANLGVSVIDNDSDEEGDSINVKLVEGPKHGTVTCPPGTAEEICSDGTFTYVHDHGEDRLDSLSYTAEDNGGTCVGRDTVKVYIVISNVNDCPIPVDDVYYVDEGGSLTVDTCMVVGGDGYQNWDTGEPNNGSGIENFALIYTTGKWNDVDDAYTQPYLIEIESSINTLVGHRYLGEYDGHSYFQSNTTSIWSDAKLAAEAAGGYLAVIKTEDENDAITAMISQDLLIGLYQDKLDSYYAEPKGAWKWLDGDYLYDATPNYVCGILLNDNDGGGDTLWVESWVPGNGNIDIDADGNFRYTHDGGEEDDTIKYYIFNGIKNTIDSTLSTGCSGGPGNIIIKRIPVNDCPIANVDTFYVDEGAILDTTGVLLNDVDVDPEDFDSAADVTLLKAIKVASSDVNHGSVVISPDGRLVYTHDGGESLLDSVQYYVEDLAGCKDTTWVYINIIPINDPPVGVDDNYSLGECDTLVVDAANGILANDSDPDSHDLKIYIVSDPLNPLIGTLLLNDDGSFTYTHDCTNAANSVCFNYVLRDEENWSDTTQVCFEIINTPPVANSEIYYVLEGEVLTTDLTDGVLSNDFDDDPFDILSMLIEDLPTNGAFVWTEDGTFSYDHDCSDDPNSDFFTYYVTDGEDTTAVLDTAKIEIQNVCPEGNNDLYSGVDEGGTLNIDAFNGVLNNDNDQNSCDVLEIKIYETTDFGGLVLYSDGSFDYTHDDSENFIDQFTYLLWDGECPSWDTVIVNIRITPVPDTPPVAVNDSFPCIDEGSFLQTLTYDEGVLFNDYDLDTGSTLSSIIVTYPIHGTLILNPNGTFIYTHDGGESISDSFTYYVRDNTGLTSDTATVFLCINPINDCPIPVDDIFNINEGDIIDSTLIFNDFDIEDDKLTINIVSPPTIGGLNWNNDGTFVYTAPDDVDKPGPEIITFDYALSDDGFNLCDSTATVTIIINYENDCPIALDDSIIIDGSEPISRIISVLDNDSDVDSEIDTTSVTIIGGPSFGEAIANINGTVTYNYEVSPINFDTITYSVSDYEGCEVLGKIYVYIENIRTTSYQLPNYFTPNGDDFNDYFVIKHKNILEKDMSFEVIIYDRYQRIVYEGEIKGSDKIWNGINSSTSQIVKTDFYYYEITPIEYFDTSFMRRREKLVGTLYLEKER